MTAKQESEKNEVQNKLSTTPFGDSQEIKALANRLMVTSVMPGASKLTEKESLLLAQISVAHGLDPFNGEAWLIKSKDGVVKGTMIGIKGLRKKARQQIERKRDGSYWIKFRDVTGDERLKYVKDDSSIVIESTLTDSETSASWLSMYAKMKSCRMEESMIINQIGEMPSVKGIGIYDPTKEFSKMNPALVARKRAEADAIKQRFDVPFGLEYTEQLDEGEAELGSPADDPFQSEPIDLVANEDDPFTGAGRPFSAPDLLNALETYASFLPDDIVVEKEEAEIVQKAIMAGIGKNVEMYGKISQYLTKCVAIPAAPAKMIKAIQHWTNPQDNPNGDTATVTGMASGELALLVSFLKSK